MFGEFLAVPYSCRDLHCVRSPMADVRNVMETSFAKVTFYPLWLLLVAALVVAMPVAGAVALVLGLLAVVGTRVKR